MNLDEATKKVRAEKPKDNFMVIEFSYDHKFLLPHKHGIALLEAMINAERLQDGYSGPKRITELGQDAITSRLMSSQEYERFKIAALLGVTPDEVRQFAEQAAQPPSSNP